jgi:hypothetical protein
MSLLEGDRIAGDCADYLHLHWPGAGLHTEQRTYGGRLMQVQLIWRADGHWRHVHVGAHRLDVAPPRVRFP